MTTHSFLPLYIKDEAEMSCSILAALIIHCAEMTTASEELFPNIIKDDPLFLMTSLRDL